MSGRDRLVRARHECCVLVKPGPRALSGTFTFSCRQRNSKGCGAILLRAIMGTARIQTDYRKGLEGPNWHPVSWLRRADRSSISSFRLAAREAAKLAFHNQRAEVAVPGGA